MVDRFVRAFDLERAPLLRVGVIQLEVDRHILMLDKHHIISDGVSMELLTQEFMRLYAGEELPSLKIQYKDYAVWQHSQVQSERMKRQEAYWLKAFAGELPVLELPTDYVRPAVQSFAGDLFEFTIDSTISAGLKQIATETGSTLYMVLLAAYKCLLHKYSGQEDIIVGTPIAGRAHADLEPLVGMFVNTLALRSYPSAEKTFMEFLQEVKEMTLQSYENQEYPFEELVEHLNVERDLSRNALFNTMFTLQNTGQEEGELQGLRLQAYPQKHTISKFDLNINVVESEEGMLCSIEYATSLYMRETIELMAEHFTQLMKDVINDPQEKLLNLEMITAGEKTQILSVFNDTTADYPREKTIHQMFEEQVERTPDAIAIVFEDQEMSYRELNERANQLARTLRANGVCEDQLVGIMAERSLEMMIGIYAILKAGGAYVPIDPTHPEERIRYIMGDANADILLVQKHLLNKAAFDGLCIILEDEASYHEDRSNLGTMNLSSHLAYVIYTSGTTGNPKGVMVEHHSVINRILWMHEQYPISASDTILQKTAITFDVSVWELFWWSMVGSKVCLLSVGGEKNPKVILDTIAQHKVTTMHFVPAMLHAFLEYLEQQTGQELQEKLIYLRQVFASGEALTPSHANRFQQLVTPINQTRLINLYGPTEATVDVSFFDCPLDEKVESVPIGKPIDNIQLYIVNANNQLQPFGVAGELCIAGVGLARGYYNRPELTAEKFVQNPFVPGERMYRTGDLARWLSDGNIEYLGRIDHQVKIRGFRIELGEIEAKILNLASIQEAIVTDQADNTGQKYLCAYFTATHEWNVSELRAALAQELPSYMIPSYFVQLEQMPLSPNGKINRKALPKPEGSIQTGTEYMAPRSAVEEKLVQIWQDILGVKTVGIKDNFFDLGGHSLRATTLVTRMHKELNVDVPLRVIFESPTVEALAKVLPAMEHHAHISIPIAEEREFYPVSSAQKRLFILHQLEGAELSYNMPTIMKIEGALDRARLEKAFRQLMVRHETLRTGFEIVSGEPVQRIHSAVSFEIEYVEAREDETAEIFERFVRAFDLEKPPLLRVGVIEVGEEYQLLMLDMHHIISDGASTDLLVQDFVRFYEGEEVAPLRIQYKDYAVWQQSEEQSERLIKQEGYWLNAFSGELPVLEMPTDYARPSVRSFEGDTSKFVIDAELTEQIEKLTESHGATMYMTLLAAYNILLAKYSGQEDLVVGSPIAGRTHADLEPIIGVFVNTLAMRNQPLAERAFHEFLMDVKQNALLAYENQEYPFEELVTKLNLQRDVSRNPLFDTMFLLNTTDEQEVQAEASLSVVPSYNQTFAKFDLLLGMSIENGEINGEFEYCTKLFKKNTVEKMSQDLLFILTQIAQDPQIKLKDIKLSGTENNSEDLVESVEFMF
ncbi:non-ribosomal peptide synthetase [Caldalkalibacillus mannanilyticus]|uniref:non-ribosomal peptide synthetase n=1 Tax=Caldalkalibacillus mannanilyticus TaxID=1418 RepID=UPI000687505A|nr:non-ribosomal peptide synthetase [Caldalkalibacillus mannanilyticus]